MRRIAVIGANYLQVPLIEKVKARGFESHVFAWEEGAVGRYICDHFYPISIVEKDQILEICRKVNIDGIISIGSDLAMSTVNYVADKLNLIGNSMQCNKVTTNKSEMRNCLYKNGLLCPKFMKVVSSSNLQLDGFRYPLIVKPTDRSGSRGVTKVYNPHGITSAVGRALEQSLVKEAIIEEFVEGHEISVETISWKGSHHYLVCTDKVTTGAPYFVEIEQHQPANLSKSIELDIVRLVQRALTCLGVHYGASHSELLITPEEEMYIVEIGARMGGDNIGSDLVPLSIGYDFVSAVIDVAIGKKPVIEKSTNRYSGIYYLTPNAGIVASINDNANKYKEIVKHEIAISVGEKVAYPVKESADRSAYFIYQADKKFETDDPNRIIEINAD